MRAYVELLTATACLLVACGDPSGPETLCDLLAGANLQIIAQGLRHPPWPCIAAMDGDWITWADDRTRQNDLFAFNFTTGTEVQITSDTVDQQRPAISGNRIVWADQRSAFADVFLYDLSSGVETRLTSDPWNDEGPVISGALVAWYSSREDAGIYLYDLASGTEQRIAGAGTSGPAASGNRVVWSEGDIYVYDVMADTVTVIVQSAGTAQVPAISGDRVVWTAWQPGSSQILVYDMSTDTRTELTSGSAQRSSPSISGDLVVWEEYQVPNAPNIFLHDLATGTTTQITCDESQQFSPTVSGNRIAWFHGDWKYDLYVLELER